jgi:hypothetical protein
MTMEELLGLPASDEKPRYRLASREEVLSAAKKILAENSAFYQRLAEHDKDQ